MERPAVVVLLDGDGAGDDARKALKKGRPHGRQVIEPEYVLQLSDLPADELKTDNPRGVLGIEDLVPLEIILVASRNYIREFLGTEKLASIPAVDPTTLTFDEGDDTHRVVERALQTALDEEFHLDKVVSPPKHR